MTALTKIKKQLNITGWAHYVKGVNINYSFKTLEKLAEDQGVRFENGEHLIVDNAKGDKRKAFKKTPDGGLIVYAGLRKGLFFEELKAIDKNAKPLVEHFNYQ